MKTKYLSFIVVIVLILSLRMVSESSASIKPIIITNMPNKLSVSLTKNQLSWYVIDDNVKNYLIFVNNSLWKNESMQSNLIIVQFSYAVGIYNLTIVVNDYSNNNVKDNIFITVRTGATSSSTGVITVTATTVLNSTGTKASPGFEIIGVLIGIGLFMFIMKFKKFRKKNTKK